MWRFVLRPLLKIYRTRLLPDNRKVFWNVVGEKALIQAVRMCIASLFNESLAISYRTDKGFDHFSIALSVGVQKMVVSDLDLRGYVYYLILNLVLKMPF